MVYLTIVYFTGVCCNRSVPGSDHPVAHIQLTLFFSTTRTTTGVWTEATTQPTVRITPNNAGSSSMTTRCLKCPPPPSSPLLPTSCFTRRCDGAAGHKRTLQQCSDAQGYSSSEDLLNKVAGFAVYVCECARKGVLEQSGYEIQSVSDWSGAAGAVQCFSY